jgi:hypothetical protein
MGGSLGPTAEQETLSFKQKKENKMHDLTTIRKMNSKTESAKIHKRARALNSGGEGHPKHAEKTGDEYKNLPKYIIRELNKKQPARDKKNRRILAKFAPDPIPYDPVELADTIRNREWESQVQEMRDAEKWRKLRVDTD